MCTIFLFVAVAVIFFLSVVLAMVLMKRQKMSDDEKAALEAEHAIDNFGMTFDVAKRCVPNDKDDHSPAYKIILDKLNANIEKIKKDFDADKLKTLPPHLKARIESIQNFNASSALPTCAEYCKDNNWDTAKGCQCKNGKFDPAKTTRQLYACTQ